MDDLLQWLLELARGIGLKESAQRWLELAIILSGLISSMGVVSFFVARRNFRKRSFLDQMVIGVNIFDPSPDGNYVLKLRTLLEGNLDTLLDNPVLQGLVRKAAKKSTPENPILKLEENEDHFLLLTKIQNAISACFASEYLLRLVGQPFKGDWADFVVTCERYGGLKATKIRVLVFLREDLKRLLDEKFFESITVEAEHHKDRLRTLRLIASEHLQEEDAVRGGVEIPVAP